MFAAVRNVIELLKLMLRKMIALMHILTEKPYFTSCKT